MHDCVLFLEVNRDLEGALARFKRFWANPEECPVPAGTEPLRVDFYVRGTSWRKFQDDGQRILRDWWSIIQWDTDLTLAREYPFDVPIGDGHTLHGTVDKLMVRYRAKAGQYVLLVSDYKSNRKVPTYGYLEEDLQFSAYCVDPQTPVLMADLTWRPIGELGVDDRILSVDEEPVATDAGVRRRHWREAVVERVWTVEKDAYRLSFSDGRQIVASGDHPFLAEWSGGWTWRTVDDMARLMHDPRRGTPGIKVARALASPSAWPDIDYGGQDYCAGYLAGVTLGDGAIRSTEGHLPFWQVGVSESDQALLDRVVAMAATFGIRLHHWEREPDGRGWQRQRMVGLRTSSRADVEALDAMALGGSDAWKAGWLSGLYDTDGSLGLSQLNYHQRDLDVLKRVQRYAHDLGFSVKIEGNLVPYGRLEGDRTLRAMFCQLVRPTLRRKVERLDGRTLRIFGEVRVVKIEAVGRRRLVDVTTSTGTFIADGLVTHNCYATTRPEFWANLAGGRGPELFEQYRDLPRWGEWVQLTGPKRMDAGERTQRHYNRLTMAVDALAASVAMRIFVPTISGDTCKFCDHRKRCGMPEQAE